MADPQGASLGPEAQFKAHLAQGRLVIQRSRSTGRFVFCPRVVVPGSGETNLDWVPASGDGTVYSITIRTREGCCNDIALVNLAEGPRLKAAFLKKRPPLFQGR